MMPGKIIILEDFTSIAIGSTEQEAEVHERVTC